MDIREQIIGLIAESLWPASRSYPNAVAAAEDILAKYDAARLCPRCGATLDDSVLAGTIWEGSECER